MLGEICMIGKLFSTAKHNFLKNNLDKPPNDIWYNEETECKEGRCACSYRIDQKASYFVLDQKAAYV